jgi:DNA polymerase-3 subunit epsilon
MREIVLDTETTGFEPATGDRLVEIGCVELINHIPTGATFHRYVNPQRDMPESAFKVHGLSSDFLADKPLFHEVVEEFLSFVGDAPLVIHNARFDIKFLDFELTRAGRAALGLERAIDTLALALRKHPGASNSLDALCQRYGIDNSRRTKHGALLDAEILAEVYGELMGGRQTALLLKGEEAVARGPAAATRVRARPGALAALITPEEEAAHAAFLAKLGAKAIWRDYLPKPEAG